MAARRRSALSRWIEGFELPLRAFGLLRRERVLWGPAAVPFGLAALLIAITLGLVVGQAGALYGFATEWLPWPEVGSTWSWLWVGPARVLLWLLARILFLGLVALLLALALVLANLLGSPFLDVLSRRVEQLAAGRIEEIDEGGWIAPLREAGRTMREEAKRTAFLLSLWVAIVLLGIVIPGGQVLAPPALIGVTILFLPLDYAGYVFDRRRLRFAERRAWLAQHRSLALGFGCAAFAVSAVPVFNVFAVPVLVVAGTLLVMQAPPAPGGDAGTTTSP